MNESQKLIHSAKKKFLLYSLFGISLIGLVSYVALDTHSKGIAKQTSIQEMYSLVTNQVNLINKILVLGEKFDDKSSANISQATKKDLKSLLEEFELNTSGLKSFMAAEDIASVKEIKKSLQEHEALKQMNYFSRRANELVDNQLLTNLETRKNVRFLADNARSGIGKVLENIGQKLKAEQSDSLKVLNQMGWLLVGLCVLQVFLIWLFVFRPLYNTILFQHEEIVNSMLNVESANRSKTDFLANISHEIRTPMTAILGYADLLKRDTISSEEKDDAVKIIDQNASHLLGLIDEILDISKIEAGKFVFEEEEADLSAFLNEVYSLINVKAEDKGIELYFKNEGRIPENIIVDPKRLKQILFNILGNAIKFTEKGYVELIVSFDEKKNRLSFRIKDTGIGISKTHMKKLFKPFEQGDSSVARKFGGTGLGLVLSKRLAKEMKGDVKIVDSKPGVGTCMEVLIDIGEPQNPELLSSFSTSVVEEKADEIDKFALRGTKVLVVDDAKENARLFKLYLSEAGADVSIAHDGESALNMAQNSFFDIVLLDLQMPGKDGFQVIKELRQNLFEKPVLALTAHAMKEEKEKTKKAGFNDHLTKPVKASELVQAICNHVYNV